MLTTVLRCLTVMYWIVLKILYHDSYHWTFAIIIFSRDSYVTFAVMKFSCTYCVHRGMNIIVWIIFGTLKFRIWFLLNHQVSHRRMELDRTWRWQTTVTTLESWWHTSQDGRVDEQNAGTWSRRRTWSWWRTYSLTSLFILVVLRWIESGSRLDDEEIEDRTRDSHSKKKLQEARGTKL